MKKTPMDFALARSAFVRRSFVRYMTRREVAELKMDSEIHQAFAKAFPEDSQAAVSRRVQSHCETAAKIVSEQRRMKGMTDTELRRHVARCETNGADDVLARSSERRPVIVAAPHFGLYALAALKLAALFDGKPGVRIFYNPPQTNPFSQEMSALFVRTGKEHVPLLNDRRGVISALRHLQSGGLLGIMPDFTSRSSANVYVPFFGRFYQAMIGTAYLLRKSGALLSYLYCEHDDSDTFRVVLSKPEDFSSDADDDDAMYTITARIYERMQKIIERQPEAWTFWNTYLSNSCSFPAVPNDAEAAVEALGAWSEMLRKTKDPLSEISLPAPASLVRV